MMKDRTMILVKTAQIAYVSARLQHAEKHFQHFCNTRSHEALHLFRVEIKKMQALLFMVSRCCKSKAISHHFKTVSVVFKHAGRIRNAYLNIRIMRKHHITDTTAQRHIQTMETRQFLSARQHYLSLIRESFQAISDELTDLTEKRIAKVHAKQFKKLTRFFSEDICETELHDCRKTIKFLLYMHDFLSQSGITLPALNVAYLDALQNAIGKWHDAVSACELLGHTHHKTKESLETQVHKTLHTIYDLAMHFEIKASPEKVRISELRQ